MKLYAAFLCKDNMRLENTWREIWDHSPINNVSKSFRFRGHASTPLPRNVIQWDFTSTHLQGCQLFWHRYEKHINWYKFIYFFLSLHSNLHHFIGCHQYSWRALYHVPPISHSLDQIHYIQPHDLHDYLGLMIKHFLSCPWAKTVTVHAQIQDCLIILSPLKAFESAKRLSCFKRCLTFLQVLQKIGKSEETVDEQFELCVQNLHEQQVTGKHTLSERFWDLPVNVSLFNSCFCRVMDTEYTRTSRLTWMLLKVSPVSLTVARELIWFV